ncbi:prostate stem cell antigen-like [Gadus macrocephalus]|uniref:prostate stem cell antigen-like n=1 Tax=Gadus macrocephalus TaxID=80720 RepID=UPI0028CB2E32|nr:prostate stem cell antigen-like [Gadus macrocephalus]
MPSSMKILLGSGLITLLLPSVVCISCFVCSSARTNEECNRTNLTCPALQDRCLTIVDIAGPTRVISKSCATLATCTGALSTAGLVNGIGSEVSCCDTVNFCNVNGAAATAGHKALPALSLLVLLGLAVR